MDGSHLSPADNQPVGQTPPQPVTDRSSGSAQVQRWMQELRRLKAAGKQVVSECTALQTELKRSAFEKAILVEKVRAMERQRAEVAPLEERIRDLTAQAERDRVLIDRLQTEFRQAILERAQLHRDLFEAHAAVDELGDLLDGQYAPTPSMEPD